MSTPWYFILAALTDIETDWHRGVAYLGMSRARTPLHVIIGLPKP